jgi:hypothetical protein
MAYKKNLILFVLSITLLLGTISCGTSDDDDDVAIIIEREQEEDQAEDGSYRAYLSSVNPDVFSARGVSKVIISGNTFQVQVKMERVPASVLHPQFIYVGRRCPTLSDDVNNDGYVDIQEGQLSYGEALIPLDRDLNSQEGSFGWFPIALSNGTYDYRETASRRELIADLREEDRDPDDSIAKLGSSPLNLSGRVVVVHGVRGSIGLPSSVSTDYGLTAHRTLPVACGRLLRIEEEESPTTTTTTSGGGGTTTGGVTTTAGGLPNSTTTTTTTTTGGSTVGGTTTGGGTSTTGGGEGSTTTTGSTGTDGSSGGVSTTTSGLDQG